MLSCSKSRKLAPSELVQELLFSDLALGQKRVWAPVTLDISVPIISALSIREAPPPPCLETPLPRPPTSLLPLASPSFRQLCYQDGSQFARFVEISWSAEGCTIMIRACSRACLVRRSFRGGAPFPKLTRAAVALLSIAGVAIQESRQLQASFLENRSSFITSRKTLSLRRPARLALKLPVLRYSAISVLNVK